MKNIKFRKLETFLCTGSTIWWHDYLKFLSFSFSYFAYKEKKKCDTKDLANLIFSFISHWNEMGPVGHKQKIMSIETTKN